MMNSFHQNYPISEKPINDTLTIDELVKKYQLTKLPDSVTAKMSHDKKMLHFQTPEEAENFLIRIKSNVKENIRLEIRVDSTNKSHNNAYQKQSTPLN